MKLFISSYQAGSHNSELQEFLGDIREVGIISNAKDYKSPEARAERINEIFKFFHSLNIKPYEIDLRPYFHRSGVNEEIDKFKFIWLAGGNIFLLRRALKYSGADDIIRNRVTKNNLVLGGESAGAVMLGPTFEGFDMDSDSDSPNCIPDEYKKTIIWEGLKIVDYVPVPHYGNSDYGNAVENIIDQLDKKSIPYRTLTDHQAILVDGEKEVFIG